MRRYLCVGLVFALLGCATPAPPPASESEAASGLASEGPSPGALPAPSATRADERSLELARIWVAEDDLQVSLRVDPRHDPRAWGEILGEVALHVVNAYVQRGGLDRLDTLELVLVGFDRQLRLSGAALDGEFVEPPALPTP